MANEHEAPAEGKEGEAKSSAPVSADGKTCKYSEHEGRLLALSTKMESLEGELGSLGHQKEHSESSEKVRDLTHLMAIKHHDLKKVIEEYENVRAHVRFSHPEKGEEMARLYPRHTLKSEGEAGQSLGLDGRLDRIKRQVETVFQPPAEIKTLRKPASEDAESDKPKRIKLSK